MKHRYFPMFCTFRPVTDMTDIEEGKFIGLSAPFPVTGQKMLDNTLENCNKANLQLCFVGFFDPLAERVGEYFSKGGFQSVRHIQFVYTAQSFTVDLFSLARSRGISLLYRVEDQKEGESDVS